ncbi:MAG: lipopolysaccharide transport periplasmic protein LptA [Deltaproteobacteria bacterium]
MRQYKNSGQGSGVGGQKIEKEVKRIRSWEDKKVIILNFSISQLLIFCLLLFTAPSLAEDKTAANTDQPITITSNNMEARKKENLVIFRGDVVAQQKDYTLYSRELHVYYADGQEIKEMIATGDVRIVQSDKVATGEKAVYTKVNRAVVLTGNPQVEQDCDVVKGEKIIMYLDEDKSVVEGSGDNRVKVIMHPKDEKTKAKCR